MITPWQRFLINAGRILILLLNLDNKKTLIATRFTGASVYEHRKIERVTKGSSTHAGKGMTGSNVQSTQSHLFPMPHGNQIPLCLIAGSHVFL